MNLNFDHSKIIKYAGSAFGVFSKVVVAFVLVAIVHDYYGLEMRLSADAPMLQVHLVIFENAPRLSVQRFVNYVGSFFKQPHSGQAACRQKPVADNAQIA
jgi:hypothetical protein